MSVIRGCQSFLLIIWKWKQFNLNVCSDSVWNKYIDFDLDSEYLKANNKLQHLIYTVCNGSKRK